MQNGFIAGDSLSHICVFVVFTFAIFFAESIRCLRNTLSNSVDRTAYNLSEKTIPVAKTLSFKHLLHGRYRCIILLRPV